MVAGLRFSRAAIERIEAPDARPNAISSRSANLKHRDADGPSRSRSPT
jgi:hypothetical protein